MPSAQPAARCLRRGLRVLAELNRRRVAGAAEIGVAVGIPRSTVHRLLLALAIDGYVRQIGDTEFFAPRERVTELSAGWDSERRAVEIAARRIDELAGEIGWPIDVSAHDAGRMVVRHSTHDRAAWSLLPRSPIGHRFPICGTAPGRMFLAGLGVPDREAFLAEAGPDERQAIDLAAMRGFAIRDGGVLPRTTSVAVPIVFGDATLLCISMAFIRSATILQDAIRTHLPLLAQISRATRCELLD